MSDNFIFPDDPDGFGSDGSESSDAPGFDANGFDAEGGEAPDFQTPDFQAPDFQTPDFEAGSFSADSFGADEPESDGFDVPAFGTSEADGQSFETPDFGAYEFAPPSPEGSAPEAPSADPVPGDGAAAPEEGVFFGGGAYGEVPFDASDLGGLPAEADAPHGDGADEAALAVSFSESEEEGGDGAPAKSEKAKKAPKKSRGKAKDGLLLGVHVTPKQVYGVLVRPTADSYEPLRQFVRNRADSQYGQGPLTPDGVELEEATLDISAEDPAVQFGGAGEIDFSAEFAGLGVVTDAALDTTATAGDITQQAQPIIFELRDILEECAQAGFARPALAFTVDAPDVAYGEISVPPEKKPKKAKKTKAKDKQKEAETPDGLKESASAPVKRERLLELLPDFGTTIDKERAQFVPMTPRDGLRRYLAVAPTASEPVAESVEMLREQATHRKTSVRTLEAEVPLLVGLVRLTSNPEDHENTAVVRVGAEDTIVLLLAGGQLHHYEPMQSVTAFDGPDTICSRVLLQQDVQGVGTVHNVIVVSEEREKELVQGFAAFYPEARVETLREGLARHGLVGPYGPLAPMLVGAAGAAVAGHRVRQKGSPFEETNLLPASLLKRKRSFDLAFGWHTLVVAMLLFLSVLYFSYLYVSQEGDIGEAEQRLAEFPPEAQLSVPQLQARIDSLQNRQATLSATLVALDSLLIDTDRWTQTTLRATRAAAQTGGIWIEEWTPSDTDIALAGYATTRANVVGLSQRLNATIEEVTFEELREYPVYRYRLRFTQTPELPQVTRVLREQAEGPAMERAPLGALDRAGAPAPTPPPPAASGAAL